MSAARPGTWPYPFWIAHRGAGKLAPENTMAAFRLGARHGYRMFECDVKLSADGVPFLLHDSTLTRTTNHQALMGPDSEPLAGAYDWDDLSKLDAGSWLGADFEGQGLPRLDELAHWCLENNLLLNIEIKPSPGTATQTGEVVARQAAALWKGSAVMPLLTSFDQDALAAAAQAAPDLPRGLLLDKFSPDWLERARTLGCTAVVCQYRLWQDQQVAAVHAAGMRALSYTVNEPADVQALIALGTDGIITDRVDLFTAD